MSLFVGRTYSRRTNASKNFDDILNTGILKQSSAASKFTPSMTDPFGSDDEEEFKPPEKHVKPISKKPTSTKAKSKKTTKETAKEEKLFPAASSTQPTLETFLRSKRSKAPVADTDQTSPIKTYSRKRKFEEPPPKPNPTPYTNEVLKPTDITDNSLDVSLFDVTKSSPLKIPEPLDKDSSIAQDIFVDSILEEKTEEPVEDSEETPSSQSSVGSTDSQEDSGRRFMKNRRNERKVKYNPFAWKQQDTSPSSDSEAFVRPTKSVLGSPRKVSQVPRLRKSHSDTSAMSRHRVFTRVRNVKEAYECQEFGETQEFKDDLEYFLSGLQPKQPLPTRCLSALNLASRCTGAAFRMFLRSEGSVVEIFKALSDASDNPSLALTAATIMYMLSRDKLKIDFDANSLEQMLKLMNVENGNVDPELSKLKSKIGGLLEPMGGSSLKEISSSSIAIESLLSMTSKKAGEWFKEDLRKLGGLSMLCQTVSTNCKQLLRVRNWQSKDVELMKQTTRCLLVLENVTCENPSNQQCLVDFEDGQFVENCCELISLCEQSLLIRSGEKLDVQDVVINCILSCLRVLINISYHATHCCELIGQHEHFLKSFVSCAIEIPRRINHEHSFDVNMAALSLLINTIESHPDNRDSFTEMVVKNEHNATVPFMQRFIQIFEDKFSIAKTIEKEQLDESSSQESVASTHSSDNGSQNTENGLLDIVQAAGEHMEGSLIAAYIAMFIGFYVQRSLDRRNSILGYLKSHSFGPLVECLKKILCVIRMTKCGDEKSVTKVIDILEDKVF